MAVKKDDILNSMKVLCMDMINNAESGTYKNMNSFSKILYSLYFEVLNINALSPNWINRDRFILSAHYDPAILYSTLYHVGYDISIDDLKRYRRVDSFTPGNLVYNPAIGVECSIGPIGSNVANAVGIALGQRYIENLCKKENPKSNLINYYTYVLCNNLDLQSGEVYEALSFASMQKLNKLIIILDYKEMQNDCALKEIFTEELEDRFDSLNFNILESKCSISDITSALKNAKKANMPSLIIVKSNKKDAIDEEKTLSSEEIKDLKKKYNLPTEEFMPSEEHLNYAKNTILNRVSKKYNAWLKEYETSKTNPELLKIINLLEKGEFNINFDSSNYELNDGYAESGILSNNKALNFIANKSYFVLSASNDNNYYCNALINKSRYLNYENPLGRNIAFGARKSSMGHIVNGIALSGLCCNVATLLADYDYLKPAIKMSASMNLKVNYIFTHDGISESSEGMVMQNFDALSSLRSIFSLNVFRPADINETLGSWEYMIKSKGPNAICVSKEKLYILKHTNSKYVQYGAYIVRKEKYHLDGTIIATGSEVATALKAAEELFTSGIDLRVVSMPSMELFLKQNPVYEEKLLPKDSKIITLEAGSTMAWNRFASNKECTIGINGFGTSGKKEESLKFVEFDYNTILMKIKKNIES